MSRRPTKLASNQRTRTLFLETLEARYVLSASPLFPGNDCPPNLDLSAIGLRDAVVGTEFTLDLIAAGAIAEDVDANGMPTNDILRFLLDPDIPTDTPVGASITPGGVFSWTPLPDQVGTFDIVVILVDAGDPALADAEVFSISVTDPNDAPLLDLNGADEAGINFATDFTEDGGAIRIVDGDLLVEDADGDEIVSAEIFLVNRPDGDDEAITVDTSLGLHIIATAYDPSTGMLLLTGADTAANYQQVLSTLQYNNSSDNPDVSEREVRMFISDGTDNSELATTTISVFAANDPPDLAPAGDATAVAGVQFEQLLMATDPDDGDTLTFQLDDGSPETATIQQIDNNTAIVRWIPAMDDVGMMVTFTVLVADNGALVDSESFLVTVEEVMNQPIIDLNGPDVEGNGFAASFTEDSGPVSIVDVNLLSITDADSTMLSGGEIRITNPRDGGAESLSVNVAGTNIIDLGYDPANGTLSLSGTDTLEAYEQVMRTLTYNNTSQDPNTTDRVIRMSVNDGTQPGNLATSIVTVNAINDAPDLAPIPDGDAEVGVVFERTVTATDAEGDTLTFSLDPETPESVTIEQVDNQTAIVRWTPEIGEEGQTITISVLVTDNGLPSEADSETFLVTVGNGIDPNAAVIDLNGADEEGNDFSTTFVEGGAAVLIVDTDLIVTDPDDTELVRVVITLTNPVDGVAEQLFADVTGTSFNAVTPGTTIELFSPSGSASIADFQQVLRTITYFNVSDNPDLTTRLVDFQADDGNGLGEVSTSSITIEAMNDGPQLILPTGFDDPHVPFEITLGESVSFVAMVVDPDTAPADLVLSLQLDDSGISDDAAQPQFDSQPNENLTADFSWTPSETGCFMLTAIVRDIDGQTDEQTFLVLVNPASASVVAPANNTEAAANSGVTAASNQAAFDADDTFVTEADGRDDVDNAVTDALPVAGIALNANHGENRLPSPANSIGTPIANSVAAAVSPVNAVLAARNANAAIHPESPRRVVAMRRWMWPTNARAMTPAPNRSTCLPSTRFSRSWIRLIVDDGRPINGFLTCRYAQFCYPEVRGIWDAWPAQQVEASSVGRVGASGHVSRCCQGC